MSSVVGRPMVQDIPEQDIGMQEQSLPQMNPKPEMGAAAAEAAVYDTSPPPLRPNPPILAESAQLSTPDMAQMCAMLAAMGANINAKMEGMNAKMDTNAQEIKGINSNMEANTRKMYGMARTIREEMQCMGAGLQGGIEQLKKGNGELLRATCWATEERGRVEVTEEVTVTETCTRHIETRETRHVEVTECTETREITRGNGRGETARGRGRRRTHTYTHTGSEGQWG